MLDDGGMRAETLLDTLPDLLGENGVAGDTFFLDEFLDLYDCETFDY